MAGLPLNRLLAFSRLAQIAVEPMALRQGVRIHRRQRKIDFKKLWFYLLAPHPDPPPRGGRDGWGWVARRQNRATAYAPSRPDTDRSSSRSFQRMPMPLPIRPQ